MGPHHRWSRPVNRLENRRLRTRLLRQNDRRGIYTELTTAGEDLLQRARPRQGQRWGGHGAAGNPCTARFPGWFGGGSTR
jgi:DNA-binding MarR family transcriptional regulator